MNHKEAKANQEAAREGVLDVPRSKSDLYRISRWEAKGAEFVDLRIFFKSKETGNFLPTKKGLAIKREFLGPILSGLESAKELPAASSRGSENKSAVVSDIPISESEIYRISKGNFRQSTFVDIRRFFKNGESEYLPTRKGVTITLSALDGVIEGLKKIESA